MSSIRPHDHQPPRVATARLPAPGARSGTRSGSLVTGAFGTVPGLLLLPYLTDTLGVAAGLAALLVLLPKAWDVLVNPVAGRISDRTRSRWGARRPYLLGGGLALAVLFARDLRRAVRRRPGRRGVRGAGVPGHRHRVRLLPGAVRGDAGRDDRRLRRSVPG